MGSTRLLLMHEYFLTIVDLLVFDSCLSFPCSLGFRLFCFLVGFGVVLFFCVFDQWNCCYGFLTRYFA